MVSVCKTKKRFRLLQIIIMLSFFVAGAISSAFADVVILNPGEIQGTIQVGTTSETDISYLRISAYDISDPTQSAEKYIYPNASSVSYSLTVNVPAGGTATYRIKVYYIYMDANRDRMDFPYQEVVVDDVSPSTVDFIVADPGFIEGTITVLGGGSVSYARMYAYQPVGEPQITSYTYVYGSQFPDPTSITYRFPVAANTGIKLQNMLVQLQGGANIYLPSDTVDIAPGETVVKDYTIETPSEGSVAGAIDFPGSATVDRYYLYTNGPASKYSYLYPPFDPGNATTYTMEGLPGGTVAEPQTGYSMYAYAYLNGNDDFYQFPTSAFDPSRNFSVVAGAATGVDISANQAYFNGTIDFSGVVTLVDLNSGAMYLFGKSGLALGGYSQDTIDTTTGAFDAILSPGSWYVNYLNLHFYRLGDPSSYLNEQLYLYNYQDAGYYDPITIAGAGNTITRDFNYKTGSFTVTFRVADGSPLSDPQLEGYCYNYEEPGNPSSPLLWYYYFRSYSSGQQDVTEGNVTLAGMKGECDVTAKAEVNGSTTTFGDLAIDIVPGAGQSGDIGGPSLTVNFPEPDICTDVTSLTVTGTVTDDVEVAGVTVNGVAATLTSAGDPGDPAKMTFEATVALVSGINEIVTIATDTSDKQTTDSRSIVIDNTDNDQDGVIDCNDNCPGVANADQTDNDGDGVGAACEECDDDSTKTAAGDCGCGNPDYDTDGDGVLDCNDNCPYDGSKTAAGACGCGVADADTDADGTLDCLEECPNDPDKTEPGICGCGETDEDGDADGYVSCQDCDDTNAAINPGAAEECDLIDHDCDGDPTNGFSLPYPECASTDQDGDGISDNEDNCPEIANAGQEDLDSDGVGDVCDSDADGDGYSAPEECDDADAAINPGAAEICGNDIDENCNGEDAVSPTISEIVVPIAPVAVNNAVEVSASFSDPNSNDTHTAVWSWGDGTTAVGTVNESSGSGTVTGSHTYSDPGIYIIGLTLSDGYCPVSAMTLNQFVVIYDSNGGFVTGGGWINSPVGACLAYPTLTGKANFGFVSKYKKGATTPTGQTEFQFKAGDLNFHSSSYDWLVIAGAKAMFKGVGTVNGEGNYGFMLSATDSSVSGGGDTDTFRIKIWDIDAGGAIVYDNQMGESDDADPTTALGGGSIVIHKN